MKKKFLGAAASAVLLLSMMAGSASALPLNPPLDGRGEDNGWVQDDTGAWASNSSDPDGPSNNQWPDCRPTSVIATDDCTRRVVQGSTGQKDYKYEASFASGTASPNGQTYSTMVVNSWKYTNKPTGPCSPDPTGVQANTPNMCLNQNTAASSLNYRKLDLGSSTCGVASYTPTAGTPDIITFSYVTMDDTVSQYSYSLPASGTCLLWQSVLEHENLHTLGLGHTIESDQNMYSSATAAAPTRPTNDTKRGLQTIYGLPSGATLTANDGTDSTMGDSPYCCPVFVKEGSVPLSAVVQRNEGRSWAVMRINSISTTDQAIPGTEGGRDLRLVLQPSVSQGAIHSQGDPWIQASGFADRPVPSLDLSGIGEGSTVLAEINKAGMVTDIFKVTNGGIDVPSRFRNDIDPGSKRANVAELVSKGKP